MSEMGYEGLRFWFDVLQLVMTAAIGLYVWAVSRHRVTNERISRLETEVDARLDNQSVRLTRVEEQIMHIPTQAQLSDVRESIAGLRAEVVAVRENFSPMRRQLELIHDYLLKRSQAPCAPAPVPRGP